MSFIHLIWEKLNTGCFLVCLPFKQRTHVPKGSPILWICRRVVAVLATCVCRQCVLNFVLAAVFLFFPEKTVF